MKYLGFLLGNCRKRLLSLCWLCYNNVMYTIDDVERILNEIVEEVPDDFFKHLNGGVVLVDECKSSHEGLYTLGTYNRDSLGRYICIYYGSFMKLYGDLPENVLREQLHETLFHEFTHHLENLAGERGLEIKDEIMMREYHRRKRGNTDKK